jgi:hypothetical protein
MLGHSDWMDGAYYELQTIKDNLNLFTPELLDRINQVVIHAGHQALKKKPDDSLVARCDSFVVKTDVHFPTDISLLWDAIRKTIQTCAQLGKALGLTEWRQGVHLLRSYKKRYRHIQQLKHSTSQDEAKRQAKQDAIKEAHRVYIGQAESYLQRAYATRGRLEKGCDVSSLLLSELDSYLQHAERQIAQIRRRVLEGERIPHEEKVFSIRNGYNSYIWLTNCNTLYYIT